MGVIFFFVFFGNTVTLLDYIDYLLLNDMGKLEDTNNHNIPEVRRTLGANQEDNCQNIDRRGKSLLFNTLNV